MGVLIGRDELGGDAADLVELLAVGADRELPKLDEKLYLDVYAVPLKKPAKRK